MFISNWPPERNEAYSAQSIITQQCNISAYLVILQESQHILRTSYRDLFFCGYLGTLGYPHRTTLTHLSVYVPDDIPVCHDMMCQTNYCSSVRVMLQKEMCFLYLT